MRYDAAGADHAAVANRNAGTDHGAAADPAVSPDGNGISILPPLAPQAIIERMMRRINLHVGSNQRMRADADIGAVEKRTVGIDKNVLTEDDAVSVIAMKRWADDG